MVDRGLAHIGESEFLAVYTSPLTCHDWEFKVLSAEHFRMLNREICPFICNDRNHKRRPFVKLQMTNSFDSSVCPWLRWRQSHRLPTRLQLIKMLQTWQVLGRRENPSHHCRFVCLQTFVYSRSKDDCVWLLKRPAPR